MTDHDKAKRWNSFRQKISSSLKTNTAGALILKTDRKRSTTNKKKSNAATSTTGFSRMKDEKSHSRMTCLPKSPSSGDANNASLPSLLCAAALLQRDRFTPLDDDDTFSIRPMIGIASRFNEHCSEIWMTDYINSTKRKAQTGHAKKTTRNCTNEKARTPTGFLSMASSLSSCSMVSSRESASGLKKDITHLSEVLNKPVITFSRDCVSRGGHHFVESNVQSTISHKSSLYTSKNSFEVDFSQLADRDRGNDLSVPQTGLLDLDNPRSNQVIATNATTCEAAEKHHSELFQPAFSESGVDTMPFEENIAEGRESNGSCSSMATDMNASRYNLSNGDLYPLSEQVADLTFDMFERQLEASHYVSNDGKKDKPIEAICFSSQGSNGTSDLTADPTSHEEAQIETNDRHLDQNKTLQHLGARTGGDGGCKKARCVVVYNKYFSESEQVLYNAMPSNVKEVVDRLEVLRRLEVDHAERFGYKDFMPIQEKRTKHESMSSSRYAYLGIADLQVKRAESDLFSLSRSDTNPYLS